MLGIEDKVSEMRNKIQHLKHALKAVIIAHNYQWPEVQDTADFVGDSLELSRKAAEVDAEVIVFCGVHFMAETAAIINPQRIVLLPEINAGCPLAEMIDVETLRQWKAKYPDAAVVCYVNSSAAVKAESDICCTSANALKVVESVPNKRVLFVPDANLGHFISKKTTKEMILYPGHCVTHKRLTAEHVIAAKKAHPEAPIVVHPECVPEVVDLADAVLSTSQMLRYVTESKSKTFLIGTEAGIMHRMQKENPDKAFYAISKVLYCPNMKKIKLESVLKSLELRRYVITVPEDIRVRAKVAIDRMLEIT